MLLGIPTTHDRQFPILSPDFCVVGERSSGGFPAEQSAAGEYAISVFQLSLLADEGLARLNYSTPSLSLARP